MPPIPDDRDDTTGHTHTASTTDAGEFPADAPAAYGASFAGALVGVLGPLLSMLGNEVNPTALASTAVRAAMASGLDNAAILRAIAANGDAIFPDPITRPWVVSALNALAGGMAAKVSAQGHAAPFLA
jgi:hypothetical protein